MNQISNPPSTIILSIQCVSDYTPQWSDEDERILVEEYERLERETAEAAAEFSNIDLNIREMVGKLQVTNHDVFEQFQKLSLELQELQMALVQKQQAAESKKPAEQPEQDIQQNSNPREHFESPPRDRSQRRQADTLYKKIAMKTHPDKTKDEELHKIFFMAKDAYKNDELDLLIEIWDGLKSGRKKFSKLRLLIKSVRERWAIALKNRAAVKGSIDFQMWTMYKDPSTRSHTEMFHRQQLSKMMEETKSRIRQLDPSRYPQPVQIRALYTTITSWN